MKNRTAFEYTIRRTRGDYAVVVSQMEIASDYAQYFSNTVILMIKMEV